MSKFSVGDKVKAAHDQTEHDLFGSKEKWAKENVMIRKGDTGVVGYVSSHEDDDDLLYVEWDNGDGFHVYASEMEPLGDDNG